MSTVQSGGDAQLSNDLDSGFTLAARGSQLALLTETGVPRLSRIKGFAIADPSRSRKTRCLQHSELTLRAEISFTVANVYIFFGRVPAGEDARRSTNQVSTPCIPAPECESRACWP